MTTADKIIREVERLPEQLAREVLDFIGYIEFKHGLKDQMTEEMKQAQEPVMANVWNNPEDDVWNEL